MRYLILIILFVLVFALPAANSDNGLGLEISVNPPEPTNFQPTDEAKNPALISVKIMDNPEETMDESVIHLRVTHVEGKGIIKTGFPHMEGKLLFEGDLPVRNNEASLEYLFPIRGNYLLEAELLRAPSMSAVGRAEFTVHVKEPSFEIRNAIILLSLLFVFGFYLGQVYGSASREVSG